MKIEHYQKKIKIQLVLEENEVLEKGGMGCSMMIFFSLFYLAAIPVVLGAFGTFFAFFFAFIWYGLLILMTFIWVVNSRPPVYFLDLNFSARGESSWKIRSATKKQKQGTFHASEVETLKLSIIDTKLSNDRDNKEAEDFHLQLSLILKNNSIISAQLKIAGINQRHEVINFGCTLSQILGIRWGNIDENDFARFSIHFQRTEKQQQLSNLIDVFSDHIPQQEERQQHPTFYNTQQLSASYQKNKIPKEQRLDKLISEDWNPEKHHFYAEIIDYSANKFLIYEYKISVITIFFTATTIALVASGFISIGGLIAHIDVTFTLWLSLFFVCAIISYLWFGFKWNAGKYLPERWQFSFIKSSIQYQKGKISKHYDLKQATELIFRLTKTSHSESSGNGKHQSRYYTYNGITLLTGIAEEKELIIGQTGELRENATSAYGDGIAFATMINKTLKLPFRLEDNT